mmetsp:Transcript_20770/g.44635  ORF Transcript_20770/g.44635 Transcript_20770/m.44635 type:complete len:410 (-) Transcript_20770:243-1472(-)
MEHELNVELEMLGPCVSVARMSIAAVPAVLHDILRLLFFTPDEQVDRFLHCSLLCGQLSLIATAEELAPLSSVLHVDSEQWRVMRVSEGKGGGSESMGVVERITARLAVAEIPVLYVSTYSLDYVLIPSHALDRAMASLGRAPRQGVTGDRREPVTQSSPLPLASVVERMRDEAPVWHTHTLCVFDDAPTQTVRVAIGSRHYHTGALLRLLFLPHADDPEHALRSFTQTPEEISILCGTAPWFLQHCESADGIQMAGGDPWIPIRVGYEDGTPLSEVGVVATQANVLMSADIPILYQTTFDCDLTLVPERDLPDAILAFESSGFTVIYHDNASCQVEGRAEAPDLNGEAHSVGRAVDERTYHLSASAAVAVDTGRTGPKACRAETQAWDPGRPKGGLSAAAFGSSSLPC